MISPLLSLIRNQIEELERPGGHPVFLHPGFSPDKVVAALQAKGAAKFPELATGASLDALLRNERCDVLQRPLHSPSFRRRCNLPFDNLSGGAREQVAAAVRLAMAEVLAGDYDGCLPVVFDDAFAYSDPDRVNQLQRMLDLAAHRGLQVIVLTCNPSDYAALGAKSINLQPSLKGISPLSSSPAPAGHDIPAAIPGSPDDTSVSTQPTTTVTAELRETFLAALDVVGGSVGNHSLRLQLDWDESTYNAVKSDLIAAGTIIPGRGRGGSVARV